MDLQAIFEHLHLGEPLPTRIDTSWVRNLFTVHLGKLYRLIQNEESPVGDPPGPSGSIVMLQILEYDELFSKARLIHSKLGHATIGLTQRYILERFWHPDIMLAVNEAVRSCHSCQLMNIPDPTLPNLMPIRPSQPLTRWALDHTGPGGPGV